MNAEDISDRRASSAPDQPRAIRASRTCRPKRVQSRFTAATTAGDALLGAFRGDIPIGFNTAGLTWRFIRALDWYPAHCGAFFYSDLVCGGVVTAPMPRNDAWSALAAKSDWNPGGELGNTPASPARPPN